MAEASPRKAIPYISAEQGCQKNAETAPNIQSSPDLGTIYSSGIYNDKNTFEENAQGSDYEGAKASIGLKRKASTSSLTENKRKRQTEEESDLDPEDPKEKIENLMIHVDALKAECMHKDGQIKKLKAELDEKTDEIKKLLVINGRYKSGLACIICTDYLANPCTINCGHSFCYSCLREWLKANKENGPKCPSCRTKITTQPVLSYALKDQVEALVEQLPPEEKKRALLTLEKEGQMYNQLSDHWAGIFDQPIRPLVDYEDGVLRCPTCGWEVEDSICRNCNQHIDVESRESRENRDNNSDGNSDSNDDNNSEIGNGNESDVYDSNDSFIDDNSDTSNSMSNELKSYVDPYDAIIINDSSSELSEEQSEYDSVKEKNVIVISSGEDNNEMSLHLNRKQPTSPLSIISCDEVENYNLSLDQDGEYTCNSDIHISSDLDEEDGSYHVH